MANIKIPKKLFEKEIGKLDEKMQDRIAMFGTPLENFNNEEIEIEIFPDRPDMLSYQGFKRSFLAFLGKKKGIKKYRINKPEKDYEVHVDSSVKEIRPYTVCAIVRKLKFDDEKIKEIIEIQEKLHATLGRKRKSFGIGIYPLDKIKLPIIYKALEPDKIKFIPLESEREMSGLEILQRHPTGKAYAHLLAGKEKFPVFIDSDRNFLSMPPIINSKLTGKITEKTRDVFIECSGFDFGLLKKCMNIIATSLADMGGEIYQMQLMGNIKENTPDLSSEKRKISVENANKLLGVEIKEKEIKNLIEKMGHGYEKNSKTVEIPAWRTDILHEVDLIEDLAIAYGYENFVPEIPEISTIGDEDSREKIKRKISEILAGLGMLEVSNYHLTNKNDQFGKMGLQEDGIEIEKSKTDYTILRKDLIHYLLKNLSKNTHSEYPQKIFETGKVFDSGGDSDLSEKEKLAVAISPGDFTEVKQTIVYLSKMSRTKIEISETEEFPDYFIEGRVAEIKMKDKRIGFIGEVHPRILRNWKIKMPVALFEIELDEFLNE
jgi:phenylalanyl-tRNA synthetase beta chain